MITMSEKRRGHVHWMWSLRATEKALGKWSQESREESMKEAAEEEKRMAIEWGVIS